jgi:hypothetical protein
MKILPYKIRNIVWETLNKIAKAGGSLNDSIRFQSAYNSIIVSQTVSPSIICEVKPQNLLLVFCEIMEPFFDALSPSSFPARSFKPIDKVNDATYHE